MMRGLTLESGRVVYREDLPMPVPRADEVLVRVSLAGVCETDLQLMRGYMNFNGILGHEFVGIAESGRWAGRRVVGEINCCPLERCDACPANRRHCSRRSVLGILARDGAFAEFAALPEENLHPVPDNVSTERAVFTEPLAAAYEILEQYSFTPHERVLVLGDGRLGYLSAQVIASTAADVCVIGKHPEKLQRFTERGLDTCLLNDVPEDWKQSRPADVVVDCTGSATGWEWACQLVRPQGTIVMKTTVAGAHPISLAPLVIDELRLIGSRCGPFPRALQALQEGQIEVESLITSRFPLQQAEQALQRATAPDQHKVLITIGQGDD